MKDFLRGFDKKASECKHWRQISSKKKMMKKASIDMSGFLKGFDKKAADVANLNPQGRMVKTKVNTGNPEKPSTMDKVKSIGGKALGAAAIGAGTYAALRKPWSGKTLATTISAPKKLHNSKFRQFADKMLYGTDKPLYFADHQNLPSKAKKVKDTVLHTGVDTPLIYKGKENIGDMVKHKNITKLENKASEAKFIKKFAPDKAIPTTQLSEKNKGKRNFITLHKAQKGQGYIIKPEIGFGSGVGGKSFINSKEIDAYLSGKSVGKKKTQMIEALMKNPKGNILQNDIGIKKSPLTGKSSEFRVHAVGGKVVPRAGSVRGGNVEEFGKTRAAEKYFQEFLDKLPEDVKKKNISWNPDVARTKDGFKIIELNAGESASGLLDPRFLAGKHKGVSGMLAGLEGTRKNQILYKSITGRSSATDAGVKALGAGGATVAATSIAKKERENNSRSS